MIMKRILYTVIRWFKKERTDKKLINNLNRMENGK